MNPQPHWKIISNLPGGNIIVDRIDGNTLFVRQDLRDTQGDWFYWYFHVRPANEQEKIEAGTTLRVVFTASDVIGVRGPAVSTDGGLHWAWLGQEFVEGHSFSYTLPVTASEVAFSLGMPYTQTNLDKFLAQYADHPYLQRDILCVSRKNRPVELIHIRPPDPAAVPGLAVLIVARHHCCEMMASYALEGMIDTLLSQSGPGTWLREKAEFMIVPFVDKDGVEDGDQGKNRFPHDHNRDYHGESIYPEVRALRDRFPRWVDGRNAACFDLHCPWIRGEYHEWVYFVGSDNQSHWEAVRRYTMLLEQYQSGVLRYRQQDDLPYGVAWNTSTSSDGVNYSKWAESIAGVRLSAAVEIPYANANGAEVNAQTAAAFGTDLARTLEIWAQTNILEK